MYMYDIYRNSSWNEIFFREKGVEKIKTRILFSITPPPRKSCRLWDNVEIYGTARQATDDNKSKAFCMLDN